jgi:hypothetical protein
MRRSLDVGETLQLLSQLWTEQTDTLASVRIQGCPQCNE